MDEDVLDIWKGGGFQLLGVKLLVHIKEDSKCSQRGTSSMFLF